MSNFSKIILLLLIIQVSCSNPKEKTFNQFYQEKFGNKQGPFNPSLERTAIFNSDTFKIDTIYRSMHGPTSENDYQLAHDGELIWITGYEVVVYDTAGSQLPIEFVCHNNLFLSNSRNFPWQANEWKYVKRLFALSQGMTNVQFPEGFGIPLPGEQNINVVYQALNHNYPQLDTNLYHEVRIKYFVESEIDFKMKPLKHRNVWLIKQYEGPPGKYDEPAPKDYKPLDFMAYSDAQQPSCGVDEIANNHAEMLDIYWDSQGRKYTGHWKIPPGTEYLEYNVSSMLSPRKTERVHYINAHIHPFCEYLELYDQTADTTVFKAYVVNESSKTGIRTISELSSEEGIMMYADHEYILRSMYNNTSNDTLSAMSVMYLYSALDS